MPVLKDLACSIELPATQQSLQEFGTIYGDGFVETFVPVPSKPQPFSIHLTSNKFIAPGIAMYVFVDGVYQCNRNRQDLKLRKPSEGRSLVEFKVRQKEEKQKDGSMIAREWTFEKLNCVQADGAPDKCSPNILENIGCIEVIILRCAGTRNAKSATQMNLDGANDEPDHYFGLDGHPRTVDAVSTYDDRTLNGFVNGYGPPPPVPSYRSPYVESVQSQEDAKSRSHRNNQNIRTPSLQASVIPHSQPQSRYSEPISPGTRSRRMLPPAGFQYGSGPIPSERAPFLGPSQSVAVTKSPGVDPVWLDKLLTRAIKQGIAESRRKEPQAAIQTGSEHRVPNEEIASQPPGIWPTSPFTKVTLPHANWNESQAGGRRDTRVSWTKESAWEAESNGNGWTSVEDTPDDWDTDETWATAKPEHLSQHDFQGRSSSSAARRYMNSRAISPPAKMYYNQRPLNEDRSRRTRSKSRGQRSRRKRDVKSSSEDNEGWTHIDATSSSTASPTTSDKSIQRPLSRSRRRTSKGLAANKSHRSSPVGKHHDRKLSQHTYHVPTWQANLPRPSNVELAPSIITPTVMNGPVVAAVPRSLNSARLSDIRSNKGSVFPGPAVSVIPPPTWGCVTPNKARKSSQPSSSVAPAPYVNSLKNFVHNMFSGNHIDNRSTSSSSWGSGKKDNGAQDSWGSPAKKTTSWNESGNDSWGNTADAEPDKSGWEVKSNNDKEGRNTANNVSDNQPADWATYDNNEVVEDTSKQQKNDAGAGNFWEVKKDNWNTANDADDPWKTQGDAWNIEKDPNTTGPDPEIPCDTAKDPNTSVLGQDDTWNAAQGADDAWTKQGDAWNTAQDANNSWQNQEGPEDNVDNNDKNNVQWGADDTWQVSPLPIETSKAASAKDDAKAASTSKRHSTKSLTKHRQVRSASADVTPKPHWQFPPLPPKTQLTTVSEDHKSSKARYITPKEPLYKISQETANEKGIEHQVRAGKGIQYGHAIGRPEYLDRLDKPYAVFRFKYRSRGILKDMFGDAIPSHGSLTLPTPNSTLAKAKEELMTLPQDQLVEKMLKLQTKLGLQEQARKVSHSSHKERKERKHEHERKERKHEHEHKHTHRKHSERRPSVSERTEVVARNLTENWVKQHSRDPSEKGKEKEKERAKASSVGKEKKEATQAWDQTGGGNETTPAWDQAGGGNEATQAWQQTGGAEEAYPNAKW